MENEKEKFFVQVRGGTEEERETVKDQFRNMSTKEDVDVDLVKVEGTNPEDDLLVNIRTPCGDVNLTKSDLDHPNILENACGEISCRNDRQDSALSGNPDPENYVSVKPGENLGDAMKQASQDGKSGVYMEAGEHVPGGTASESEPNPLPTDIPIVGTTGVVPTNPGDSPETYADAAPESKKEVLAEDDIPGDDGN